MQTVFTNVNEFCKTVFTLLFHKGEFIGKGHELSSKKIKI